MKTDTQQPKISKLHSMTVRLPAMYALIALAVVLILGVVLYATLRWYYTQQERAYLVNNAQPISRVLQNVLPTDNELRLQAQASLFSFLARAQVDILDDNQTLIATASTFDPDPFFSQDTNSTGFFVESARIENDVVFDYLLISPSISNEIVFQDGDGVIAIQSFDDEANFLSDDLPFTMMGDVIDAFDTRQQPIVSALNQYRQSSDVVYNMPLYDETGNFLGTLRLSNGPAYGRQIIDGVMVGWLIASVVSVGLAVILGWIASRDVVIPLRRLSQTTQKMADGDLSARTSLSRKDEFGILSTSFDDMAQQIETTVITLRRFVSDAAHEINTPITALRTNIELIDPQHNTQNIERALQQIQRLEDLTQNLLHLSRLETNADNLSLTYVNIGELTKQVAQLHASQAEQANLDMVLSIPREEIIVLANETQLHQAVSNLVHNAIKFTDARGTIWITVQHTSDIVRLTIEDTGIGFPNDDLPYLFNRFHRGRNANRHEGSGLGLAIVKAIITQYGGMVTASNTGKGAKFVIELPYETTI
ncbi:MAG: HAMP domain-containing sensor histidine kinase [Chloroflexota bacterium]